MKKEKIMCIAVGFCLGTCVGAGGYYVFSRRIRKPVVKGVKYLEVAKKEKYYVFFSPEGKPVTLSEQEVFDIKQKHEDGVLPTFIAQEIGMSPVMVCRIINCLKSI